MDTHTLTHTCTHIQKLLQNIQMKEQQKIFEAQLVSMATHQLAQQSAHSPEILQALRAMQEATSAGTVEAKQAATATVFAAPTGIPEHIANSLSAGRK